MANVKINVEVIKRAAEASLKSIQNQAKKTQTTFDKMNKGVTNSTKNFAKFGVALGALGLAAATVAVGKFASSSVSAAIKIENLTTRFETLTGSTAQATKTMRELQQFAASTPFQLPQLAETTAKLIGFGFNADEAKDKLQILGDVAAASGTDIGDIGLIFGQVSAAGKLTGERLLQLQERAIPIGPAIAKTMGIAESAVKDAVTKGKVDFATFERAFESLNDTGQFAFEGMTKASLTLQGRISTLKDNFALLQNDVGQKLLPAFKAITTAFTSLIQKIQASEGFNQLLTDIGNNIPKAISFAIDSLKFLNNAFQNTRLFLNFISFAFDQFIIGVTELAISTVKAANAIKSFFGVEVDDSSLVFLESLKSVSQESADATEKATLQIINSRDELNRTLDASGKLLNETYQSEKASAEAAAVAVVDSNNKRIVSTKELTVAEQAALTARVEAEKKAQGEIALLKQALRVSDEEDRLLAEQSEVLFRDQRLVDLEGFFTREEEAAMQAKVDAVTLTSQKEAEILKIELEGQKRRRKAAATLSDWEKKTQEEKNRFILQSQSSMFGGLASLSSLGGAKLFKITKAFNLAEASTSAVLAVQKAAAAAPYPANIPGIVAETARGAANVGRIIGTKAPSFQDGGIVPGSSFSGDNVAANVNSGEVILNREQQAQTLFAISNGAGAGGGENVTNVTVELDGEVVGRAVSRQVRDGLELGEIA